MALTTPPSTRGAGLNLFGELLENEVGHDVVGFDGIGQ
jgi:hypothetical protein